MTWGRNGSLRPRPGPGCAGGPVEPGSPRWRPGLRELPPAVRPTTSGAWGRALARGWGRGGSCRRAVRLRLGLARGGGDLRLGLRLGRDGGGGLGLPRAAGVGQVEPGGKHDLRVGCDGGQVGGGTGLVVTLGRLALGRSGHLGLRTTGRGRRGRVGGCLGRGGGLRAPGRLGRGRGVDRRRRGDEELTKGEELGRGGERHHERVLVLHAGGDLGGQGLVQRHRPRAAAESRLGQRDQALVADGVGDGHRLEEGVTGPHLLAGPVVGVAQGDEHAALERGRLPPPPAEQAEADAVPLGGLLEGELSHELVARPPGVSRGRHRPADGRCRGRVEGELHQVVVGLRLRLVELGRQPAVHVHAPVGSHPVLDRGAHSVVDETEVVGLPRGFNDLLGYGLVGRRQQPVGRDFAGAGHRVQGELGADDGGHRQKLASAGVHPGQAPGHAGVDRLREGAGVDRGQVGADVPQQLGEEQGVALGPQPEGVHDLGLGQDADHGVPGDAVEHLVADVGVARQVGEEGGHGVGPVDRRVAVDAHDHHRDLAGGGQHVLEEPDRGAVGPVEVVDDDEEGGGRGQLGDQSGSGVEQLPPVVGEGRHVRRPGAQGGGDVGQHAVLRHHVGGRGGGRPGQQLGDGCVRGRGVRGTGAPQHAPTVADHLPSQPFDERGLAHPRLTGQDNDLAVPVHGSTPRLAQLLNVRLAADEGGKVAPIALGSIHGGPTDTGRHPRPYRRPFPRP